MHEGRTGRGGGACLPPSRTATLRGIASALIGGLLAVGVAAVAVAAPAPPEPPPGTPTPDATVAADVRPDDAPAGASLGATSNVGNVAVVTWFEGVPTPWPITVTILEPGVTFADGSTSVDVTTDPTGEPLELSLVGVPAAGARVRLQEPDRSDATFQDVVCESSGSWYDTMPIERGVELIVPPLADGSGGAAWGHWRPFPVCWFENVAATRITVASHLDGGAPAPGAAMAVVPTTGRVGTNGVFAPDGIVPIGAAPVPVELTGFPSDAPLDVFVGQVMPGGTTLYAMVCTSDGATFDGPLESRTIGDQTVVGIVIPVAPHGEVSCSVDTANADLRAVKTASIDAAGPGAVFDYTIVATNAGRAPLFGVAMSDGVPAELSVLDVRADEATTTCTTTGNRVDCSLGDLAPGAVRTVRVTVSVHPDVVDAAAITNVAIVRGEVPLWIPGLGTGLPVAADGTPAVAAELDRPPVFARAVQVLATSIVKAFAPTPSGTAPPTTTTVPATSTTAPATSAPATAVEVTVASTPAVTAAPATAPTTVTPTVDAAQQGPLPTVTGGTTLPTTGNDLSLVTWAAWTTVAGIALVAVRRARRTTHG